VEKPFKDLANLKQQLN